ncbi:DUF397 domain-containing protein [Streptomyces sp. NPDC014006]|uniref:DUF397 domain-containing protein n=1 Tax=Streptomyces sp. NPDC014006 TaxID=3364870 RepID=UPI0036FE24FE
MSDQMKWFKSSYSDSEGAACVEVAATSTTIHIRDSKTPAAPHLAVPAPVWTAFIAALQPGA